MPLNFSLDPARSAVLSMDLQKAIVSLYAREPEAFLRRVARVLDCARRRKMRVIHVRVGFRPSLPEIGERNVLFASVKNSPQHRQIFEGPEGEIHPAVGPHGDDVVVVKHRVSAFTGTDLEMILRANGIETLVLWGIATSGVVLSTLLDAFDADYRLAVIKDCCADRDPELHACLVDKFYPHRATVLSADEFLEAVPAVPGGGERG